MRLSTALRLGRVSSLPTVVSNVLAAIALAGGFPHAATLVLVCVAMSLFYLAGTFLNDAFDRDLDRVDRLDRPIPAGEVHAATVFDAGFVMLFAGVLLVVVLSLATGAGGKPILCAIWLGSLIVFYDAHHKGNAWAPLLMGLIRASVYVIAALLVRPELSGEVLVGAALLVAYLVGLTVLGREQLTNLWPLALLGLVFAVARPTGPTAVPVYAAFFLWVLRALVQLRGRQTRVAVTGLVAGISLLDAVLIANLGRPGLSAAAIAAFLATTALQKLLPDHLDHGT